MQSWHTTYLGLKVLPRELSAFELKTFFTFSHAEREVIDARYGAALAAGGARRVEFCFNWGWAGDLTLVRFP